MEENKNLDLQPEVEEVADTKKAEKSLIKKLKAAKPKKLRNQLFFKKGGYSIAITALVLVAVILFNWIVGALADRFDLQFDMTAEKQNTLSEENVEFVKGVDKEVSIIFCATEADYNGGMMSQYASYYHNVSDNNDTDYYSQTLNIVKKYADYNKNIKLEFIDTQSTEFSAITANYPTDNVSYGDIIVSATAVDDDGNPTERHKVISYGDIYSLADESGYAAMGYGAYTIGSNNIETELTSAIAFVLSAETKKVALVTGHSTHNLSESYRELLEANNYEVTIISDSLISEISNEFDIVALVAPSIDFLGSELDVISKFLDNDSNLQKGLIYFADATAPVLSNLSSFLMEWGIEVGNGILFETEEKNHMEGDPYTMGIYPAEDDITKGMTYCITGYNMPLLSTEPVSASMVVTELMTTLPSVVEVPKGSDAGYSGYSDSDKATYAAVIQSEKTDYDDDNNEISSYVMAFSSIEFIYSDWAEYDSLSNKNIVLAATDRAAKVGDSGITFISKTITNESFADAVNSSDVTIIRLLFCCVLPIACIVLGIVIFIRRKNAQ
ncbi:MAG: hypothetical protein E7561_05805 [Ruminococcaceae bacterium]|nr:hypothetical protein [Oscillospiraceae bacterium]